MRTLLRALFLSLLSIAAACGSRADLDSGRYYRCDFQAGATADQCPGDWICTRDGFCQDPAVGAPLECVSSADCTGGWHCGVDGQCYDRTEVTDVKCRVSEPDDCAPGWRCGLEGVCHDTQIADAYRCDDGSDTWCEQGWRCGASRVCVDSRLEALRDSPDTLTRERIAPLLPMDVLEAAGGRFSTPDDDTLELYVLRTADGAWIGRWFTSYWGDVETWETTTVAMPGLRAVAAAGDFVFLLDGASLQVIDTTAGDFPPPVSIDPGTLEVPTGLRTIADARETLAVIAPNGLGFVAPGELSVSRIADLGGARVQDVADVTYRGFYYSGGGSALGIVASTDAGLFIAYQSVLHESVPLPDSWIPVSAPGLGHGSCSDQTTARPRRVRTSYSYSSENWWLGVEVTDGAGPPRLAIYERAAGAYPDEACPAGELVQLVAPVDPCPGATLKDFGMELGYPIAIARCSLPDGTEFSKMVTQGEDGQPQLTAHPMYGWDQPADAVAVTSPSNPSAPIYLDGFGRLGVCEPYSDSVGGHISCEWVGINRAPMGLVHLPDGGYGPLIADWGSVGNQYYWYADLHELREVGFRTDERSQLLGLTAYRPEGVFVSPPCAVIEGHRGLVATCVPGQDVAIHHVDAVRPEDPSWWDWTVPRAVLRSSASAWAQGQSQRMSNLPSATTATADGGTVTVMAVYDALWVGNPRGAPDGGTSHLEARIVPQARGQITAVTLDSPTEDGPYVGGYLIAQERVYRISARSELQWSATPVDLPEGRPLQVWSDGRHGRVGLEDGRVYSLPSAVQIGEALPSAAGPVVEYGAMCGHGFALTRSALYQLDHNADGGVVGTWREVSLDGFGVPRSGRVFSGIQERLNEGWDQWPRPDRLDDATHQLLLFNEGGTLFRIANPGCGPT